MKALFANCNLAIRNTRGVALAIAMIESEPQRLTFASIGNIRAALIGEHSKLLPGDGGIVGAGFTRLVPFETEWKDRDLLVMWTDGMPLGLPLNTIPTELSPEEIAHWLADSFTSGTDDVGVLCARMEDGP